MAKGLPYRLQEGQVAYARKVMANFEALMGLLNNITIDGKTGDLETVLQELFNKAVLSGEPNSDDITFADGDSLQDKYDSGQTALALMTGEGMFYFFVEDGRLKVVTNGNISADDFTINDKGHLIYTVSPSAEQGEPVVYDLGYVRGPEGPASTGDMSAAIYDPNSRKKDVCHYYGSFRCNSPDWVDGKIRISDDNRNGGDTLASRITATTGHFMFKPAQGEDAEKWQAWWDAQVICTAQGDGWFELQALGKTPDVNILLDVDMWI